MDGYMDHSTVVKPERRHCMNAIKNSGSGRRRQPAARVVELSLQPWLQLSLSCARPVGARRETARQPPYHGGQGEERLSFSLCLFMLMAWLG